MSGDKTRLPSATTCVIAWSALCVLACVPLPPRAQAGQAAGTTAASSIDTHGFTRVSNPDSGNAAAIAEGHDLFEDKGCSSCHGAEGGGGICPSLVNDAWVYGSDDTTLFNLIRRGSAAMRAAGYVRGTQEEVAGDMPPLGSLVSDAEAWQLIAYVRAKYTGDPARRNW